MSDLTLVVELENRRSPQYTRLCGACSGSPRLHVHVTQLLNMGCREQWLNRHVLHVIVANIQILMFNNNIAEQYMITLHVYQL